MWRRPLAKVREFFPHGHQPITTQGETPELLDELIGARRETALELIESTVKASPVPATLKMRLGWDHETINAPDLARRAENAGIFA